MTWPTAISKINCDASTDDPKQALLVDLANAIDAVNALISQAAKAGALSASGITGAAPLDSPTFTGVPTVPTASPGTNTTQGANTAFVAAALSGFVPYIIPNNTPVSAKDTSGIAHSLLMVGADNYTNLINAGGTGCRVLNQAGSALGTLQIANASIAAHAVTLGQFPSSLGSSGWKKYPDSNSPTGYFIEQWGYATSSGSAGAAVGVTYPIAFPNAVFAPVATPQLASTATAAAWVDSVGLTNMNIHSNAASVPVFWNIKGY